MIFRIFVIKHNCWVRSVENMKSNVNVLNKNNFESQISLSFYHQNHGACRFVKC